MNPVISNQNKDAIERAGWNHNLHYARQLLRALPSGCTHCLDAGCGVGQFSAELAYCCGTVVGIDSDPHAIERARAAHSEVANLSFVHGDFMTAPLPAGSFDLVTLIATLHHLPLQAALVRALDLLRPGGTLAVVGLYRPITLADHALAALALPVSWTLRSRFGCSLQTAPMQPPRETLASIRSATQRVLGDCDFRRRLLFRFTLLGRKQL